MTSKTDGTTHADGCHRWGPRHYDCAAREIERLERELSAIYDAFQIGQSVRTLPILLTNISNARRRSDCLSGVEALFTVPADPDDEESINTCPLRWGAERDEYVRQFKAALTARAGRELAEARADIGRIVSTYDAYRRRGVMPAPAEYEAVVKAIEAARLADAGRSADQPEGEG